MKIAIASGKGGTGKTTISTNFARYLSKNSIDTVYCDCDVEEPNGHLFFPLKEKIEKIILSPIPEIDQEKCIHCGKCAEICQYNALACLEDTTLVFSSLCHVCGGCYLVCPVDAIKKKDEEIGKIYFSSWENLDFRSGRLVVGKRNVPELISALKKTVFEIHDENILIFDSPPGATCPVIETFQEMDHVLLIAEPTPFGLHDLSLIAELCQKMKIPHSVFINKYEKYPPLEDYLNKKNIKISGKLPLDSKIAEIVSSGKLIVDETDAYSSIFSDLLKNIKEMGN